MQNSPATQEKDEQYIPSPQAILNLALKDLAKALDAADRSQNLLLERLHSSSNFLSEIEGYAKYGSKAPKRKVNAFGEKEQEEGVAKVEN